MKNTILMITAVVASALAAPAQNLTSLLQKGLAEEEINRDPAAAIEQYGILLEEFDKGRQLAATALFRIAECHRKLGDEATTAKNLQQLIALYPKQEKLVVLARQNLTALGVAPALPVPDGLEMSVEEAKAMMKSKAILRDRPDAIKDSKHLFEAIEANQVRVTRFLLEQGSSPNSKDPGGALPLMKAVGNANLSIVKLLLSHGADVTPRLLFMSVKLGYPSIEPLLLDAIKTKGEAFDYFLALDTAIAENLDDVFNRLVANGADPKALGYEGQTLLHSAAYRGHAEVCERLIKTYELPVNHRNEQGLSALDYAAHSRSPETVKVLLSLGADAKALAATRAGYSRRQGERQDISVLMQLLGKTGETDHKAIVSIIDQLITAGVDVNHQDSQGDTALHYAAIQTNAKSAIISNRRPPLPGQSVDRRINILTDKGLAEVVVALLKAGADKSIKNKEGMAPADMIKGLETVLDADK